MWKDLWFGVVCCHGNCVDIQSDPKNCGACFQVCLRETKCTYCMCDYVG